VKIAGWNVSAAEDIVVTYNGDPASVTDFFISHWAEGTISLDFDTTKVTSSETQQDSVNVEISPVGVSLTLSFKVFIDWPNPPVLTSLVPPFYDLSTGTADRIFFSLENVPQLENMTVTFVKNSSTIAAQFNASFIQTLLTFDLPLPDGIDEAKWTVRIEFETLTTFDFPYDVRGAPKQAYGVNPHLGSTGDTVVIQTENLLTSSTTASQVTVVFSGEECAFDSSDTWSCRSVTMSVTATSVNSSWGSVVVVVPQMGTTDSIYSISVTVTTPEGSATAEYAFDWIAPILPTLLWVSPESAIDTSEQTIELEVEGFALASSSAGETLPTTAFSITIGGVTVTTFESSRITDYDDLAYEVYNFRFNLPTGLSGGNKQLVVSLIGGYNVTFDFTVNVQGQPYLVGGLTPSQCYVQGGGQIFTTIQDFPANAIASDTVVTFEHDGDSRTATGLEVSVYATDVHYTGVGLAFTIPASVATTSHSETVRIAFSTGEPVISKFEYKAMPTPELVQISPAEISIAGGSTVKLILRNLGKHASTGTLKVMFDEQYDATVQFITCDAYDGACDEGLVECEAWVTTPDMGALSSMGSVSVKAFWSDLGVTNAAVGDIIVFNPIEASISYINQIEGYNSVSTPIQVQVDQFKHNGAYPSASGAVEAFFLVAGSDTEHLLRSPVLK
jgi:hypothetical protein